MELNINKKQKPKKRTEKHCQYPGCDTIFYGIMVSKFCDVHRVDGARTKEYKRGNINAINQTIEHKNFMVTNDTVKCALEGCNCKFELKIIPRTFIYPKYCEKHRNEYKRILHLTSIDREDLIESMLKDSDFVRFSWKKREKK